MLHADETIVPTSATADGSDIQVQYSLGLLLPVWEGTNHSETCSSPRVSGLKIKREYPTYTLVIFREASSSNGYWAKMTLDIFTLRYCENSYTFFHLFF
jgi:hypothetical protein